MKYLICTLAILAAGSSFGHSQVLDANRAVHHAWQNRAVVAAARAEIDREAAAKSAASAHPATRLLVGRGSDRVPGATDQDLALIQPLDIFGVGRAAAAIGDARIMIAEARLRTTQQTVQNEVLTAFNRYVLARRRLAITQELLTIARRLRDVSKQRFDLGESAEVHALRSEIEFQRASQTVALREGDLRVAATQLRTAMGLPPEEELDIAPQFYSVSELGDIDLKSSRGDLLALAGERRLIDAEVRAEQLENRPELGLELRRSPWTDRSEFGLRVQFSLPVHDFGRGRGISKSAQLRREAADKRFNDALAQAESERKESLLALTTEHDQVARSQQLRDQAVRLVQMAQLGFEKGAYSLVETLEASRAQREVEDALIDAEFRLAEASVQWVTAVGYLLEEPK